MGGMHEREWGTEGWRVVCGLVATASRANNMNHRVTEPQRRREDMDSRRERKAHSAAGSQSKRQEQPRNTPNTRKQAGKQFPVPFRVFSVFRGSRRSSTIVYPPPTLVPPAPSGRSLNSVGSTSRLRGHEIG